MSLRLELEKELERKFRELAMRRYGFTKGAIKKAAETAIRRWTEASETQSEKKGKSTVIEKSLKLLESGIEMGRFKFKSRDELHERQRK